MADDMTQTLDAAAVRETVRISSIVSETIPLRHNGRELIGRCPFHADRTPSLSVSDSLGLFNCFGCGAAGDVFDFVMRLEGVTFPAAVARGLVGNSAPNPRPSLPVEDRHESTRAAVAIWTNARPIQNTPAERYLERRGILLGQLPPLDALRFARLSYRGSARKHPALIAAVTDVDGQLSGIQRTYLTDDGHKLQVEAPKLSLGRIKGCAIQIGAEVEELIVSEGLEDSLSILVAMPDRSAWVAAGAGMMAGLQLPEKCRIVTIAADNDEAGRRAADEASAAFQRAGKRTRIMRPLPGFKDFNQQLQEKSE
jgi:DNA primase